MRLEQPAVAVGEICRDAEVPYLIDGCQAVGQMPIDVRRLHCDFLAAACRKFLRGPATEMSHVSEVFTRLALSHLGLHLTLRHSGRLVHDIPASAAAIVASRRAVARARAARAVPVEHLGQASLDVHRSATGAGRLIRCGQRVGEPAGPTSADRRRRRGRGQDLPLVVDRHAQLLGRTGFSGHPGGQGKLPGRKRRRLPRPGHRVVGDDAPAEQVAACAQPADARQRADRGAARHGRSRPGACPGGRILRDEDRPGGIFPPSSPLWIRHRR